MSLPAARLPRIRATVSKATRKWALPEFPISPAKAATPPQWARVDLLRWLYLNPDATELFTPQAVFEALAHEENPNA